MKAISHLKPSYFSACFVLVTNIILLQDMLHIEQDHAVQIACLNAVYYIRDQAC